MKTIDQALIEMKQKKLGLMTHVVVGFPSLKETREIVKRMAESGADFIELQIPFSDPMADGPTIMKANDIALANGVRLDDCLELMSDLSKEVDAALLFMTYYQMVFHRGVAKFCKQAKQAGAQGLIVPDMPLDEESHEHFMAEANKQKLSHIRLLSPTSTDERIKLNAKVENGFVYCTSRSGTTGAGQEIAPDLKAYLKRVKKYVKVPVAVGFGISKPEHLAALVGHAEMAVVGSAAIDCISNEGVPAISKFIKNLQSQL
jgi:tryptophan synthase alpha chain